MAKTTDTRVIHVEIKDLGKHYYFASPAAIYKIFTVEQLGIQRQSLLNYWQTTDEPYENNKCIIRKGSLYRNSQS